MYARRDRLTWVALCLLFGSQLAWSANQYTIEIHIPGDDSTYAERLIFAQSKHLLDSLTNNGYPFAKVLVVPESLTNLNGSLSAVVSFQIETGSFYRIGSVRFPGRKLTSEQLLTLESRLERGEMFSREKVSRVRQRLERLSYVARVDSVRLYDLGNGIISVELPILEQKVNRVSGIVSMVSGSDKPTGELTLSFGNLLGTGRQLGFAWRGLNPDRRGITFNYREPWLFKKPLHPLYELERWEDSLSIATRHTLDIEWEPFDRVFLTAGATTERITFPTQDTVSSNALLINTGASINQMDSEWNPTNGYSVSYRSSNGVRRWKGIDRGSSRLRREMINLSGATTMNTIWVFYGRFSLDDVSGSAVVTDDLVRLGGFGSIRGYKRETFLARGSVTGGGEVRWQDRRSKLNSGGYIGLFADLGYVYRFDPAYDYFNRLLTSFGVTTSILTNAGRLGLDIGWATDEPIDQARLHVRLESRF